MNTTEAIRYLEKQIKNPTMGLPKDIFLFVSRITPLVNVDLLIKNERGHVLLSWRDDRYVGRGWHIPGGIVRSHERLEERIKRVSLMEIGVMVQFNPIPVEVNQVIYKKKTRGHFISFLYECFLSEKIVIHNHGLRQTDNGYLRWHTVWPMNIIGVHKKIYKKYFV
jgi:colanic acid biosynthesis protein WcaH